MRNPNEAAKVNNAAAKVLAIFAEANLTEEEMRDALKATEVALGMKPPMPPHRPPMGPEGTPPHRPPMGPEGMPPHRPPMGPEGTPPHCPPMPPHHER